MEWYKRYLTPPTSRKFYLKLTSSVQRYGDCCFDFQLSYFIQIHLQHQCSNIEVLLVQLSLQEMCRW